MDSSEIASYLEGGAAALASGEIRWVRHTIGYDKAGCAYGACNYADHKTMYFDSRIGVIEAVNAAVAKRGYSTLADYNDAPGRTKDQVIDMLTLLAKDFRNA